MIQSRLIRVSCAWAILGLFWLGSTQAEECLLSKEWLHCKPALPVMELDSLGPVTLRMWPYGAKTQSLVRGQTDLMSVIVQQDLIALTTQIRLNAASRVKTSTNVESISLYASANIPDVLIIARGRDVTLLPRLFLMISSVGLMDIHPGDLVATIHGKAELPGASPKEESPLLVAGDNVREIDPLRMLIPVEGKPDPKQIAFTGRWLPSALASSQSYTTPDLPVDGTSTLAVLTLSVKPDSELTILNLGDEMRREFGEGLMTRNICMVTHRKYRGLDLHYILPLKSAGRLSAKGDLFLRSLGDKGDIHEDKAKGEWDRIFSQSLGSTVVQDGDIIEITEVELVPTFR